MVGSGVGYEGPWLFGCEVCDDGVLLWFWGGCKGVADVSVRE